MMLRSRMWAGCAFIAACLTLPTRDISAQASRDSIRADSAARRLKAVEVTETRAVATPGGTSAVVIKTENLRSSPAPLLEEALRESPFVHVRQNSRGEMELSIRGSDSRQAAVLLDGVPITLGWDHRTDPSLVPLTGAQNLVIVRGLSSLLSGPNTLGGSIEVSHDDAFGRLGGGRAWGGLGVDENGAYVASVGGGRQIAKVGDGELSLRGGIGHRARDGFVLPKGATDATAARGLRTNSDLREADGFVGLRWGGSAGGSLGLMATGFNAERGVPPEEHLVAPRLWRYPYHSRAIASLSGSTGTRSTPFGWASLDVGAGYNTGRLKIESFSDRTFQTVAGAELGDERTMTGRALFSHSLPRDAWFKAAATLADINYSETLPGVPTAEYQQRLLSAGAEVDIPLATRTTLAGGLVFDRSNNPKTGGRTPQEPLSNFGWRAGLTHDLSRELRVHVSASQRSRFPALRELYSGALDRFMPNPDLKPETLLGFETGVTVDRSLGRARDARFQLNAFHHNLDNGIVRITLPAPDRRFRRINRDRIETTGAEMLAGLAFGENRERSVTVTGDAQIQRITIVNITAAGQPSRHAENNPEARGMVELGVPLPLEMRFFTNARYTGRQYCLNADTGNEMTLDAKTETNGALERSFVVSRERSVRSVRALIALDNATNLAIFDQCGLPQPGRTLRVMLSFR